MWLAGLLVALCIAYGLFQARALLAGPQITIENPRQGETVRGVLTTVEGTAKNISHITLNGRKIYTDPDGKFSELALVPRGYAVFRVGVTDRFDRHREERVVFFGDPRLQEVVATSTAPTQYITHY